MALIVTAATPAKCDANTTKVGVTEWGTHGIVCQVRTGLRAITDASGTTRYYCASLGHLSNVMRRYGVRPYVSEIEDDGLGQAKAAADARADAFERGVLTFESHGHAVDVDLA